MSTQALEIARDRELILSGRGQAIREAARVSRSEVAKDIGVDEASVWRWETGRRTPRGECARRYGQLLRQLSKVGSIDG